MAGAAAATSSCDQGLARGKGPALLIVAWIFYDLEWGAAAWPALGCAGWVWVQREVNSRNCSMFAGGKGVSWGC